MEAIKVTQLEPDSSVEFEVILEENASELTQDLTAGGIENPGQKRWF